jgi:hypothetical protein
MQVKTNVFLSESDIRLIIKKHLDKEGFKLIGELEIIVKAKNEKMKGFGDKDVLGINAEVRKQGINRISLPKT